MLTNLLIAALFVIVSSGIILFSDFLIATALSFAKWMSRTGLTLSALAKTYRECQKVMPRSAVFH